MLHWRRLELCCFYWRMSHHKPITHTSSLSQTHHTPITHPSHTHHTPRLQVNPLRGPSTEDVSAVLRIQAWLRGFRVRRHLLHTTPIPSPAEVCVPSQKENPFFILDKFEIVNSISSQKCSVGCVLIFGQIQRHICHSLQQSLQPLVA